MLHRVRKEPVGADFSRVLHISISRMCPKGGNWSYFPRTRRVLRTATCMLALFSSTCSTRADVHPAWENETSFLGEADHHEDFEDLPEGFHKDVDSITIAAGGHHTCALEYRPGVDFGGPVRCWGRNDWGQSSPPGDIFVQVSAGDRHSCGIKTDQTVACWGHMRFAPRGLFQQLSVGSHHTCGLQREGRVVCWGDDIGGSTSGVSRDTVYVQVVAGRDNSCGIRPNGRVDCWGSNMMGQSMPPRDVQFRQLSASNSRHVCGVTLSGDIQCWGRDMRGETEFMPGPWQQVTCGQWTTCGIRESDRGIECWGMNRMNQTTNSYEEVSSADFHTCAVTGEGELECWGNAFKAEQVPDGFLAA